MKFPLENVLFSGVKIGVNQILPIVVLPYLMTVLGDYQFGVLMIVQTLSVFAVVVVEFGFGLSGVRLVTEARDDGRTLQIYRDVNIVKLAMCLGCAVLLWGAVQVTPMDDITRLALVAGFLSVLGAALQPLWFFTGLERFKLISLTQVVARGACLGGIFLVVRSSTDILSALVLYFLPNVLSAVFLMLRAPAALHAGAGRAPAYRYEFRRVGQIFMTGWSYFLAQISAILFAGLNTLVVGYFSGAVDSGRYAMAEKIMRGLAILSAPVTEAIYPRVVAGLAANVDLVLGQLRRWFLLGTTAYGVVSLVVILGWALVPAGRFDPKWMEVWRLLAILSPIPGLIFANNICGTQILLGLGKVAVFRNVLMASCAGLVGCSLLFSYLWGLQGAAFGLLVGETLIFLGMWWASNRTLGRHWLFRSN